MATAEPTSLCSPDLLPSAHPFTMEVGNDAMSLLYTSLSGQRQNQLQLGKSEVTENEHQQQKALNDQLQAIQREEADRPHGFWSDLERIATDVGKIAAVVGSVAVTVATAGAGAPLVVAAAIALSIGGMVISETHCLGNASMWVGLGMEFVGAGLGLGGAMAVTGLSGGAKLLLIAGRVSEGVAGAAQLAGGTAHVVNGVALANVQVDAADATAASQSADRLSSLTTDVIDNVSAEDKSQEGAQEALRGAIETHDQTAVAVVASIRG
jgi:hypothetical protein